MATLSNQGHEIARKTQTFTAPNNYEHDLQYKRIEWSFRSNGKCLRKITYQYSFDGMITPKGNTGWKITGTWKKVLDQGNLRELSQSWLDKPVANTTKELIIH